MAPTSSFLCRRPLRSQDRPWIGRGDKIDEFLRVFVGHPFPPLSIFFYTNHRQSMRHLRSFLPHWSASLQGRTVPLIFLDTPQIDLLERVRRSDPVRYSSFRDTWKRRGCTLVLTLAQEGELRRYLDASRREGRYQVLADLAPIRRDVPREYRSGNPRTLIAREIVRAVLDRRSQQKTVLALIICLNGRTYFRDA